jgi:hypothetical protein
VFVQSHVYLVYTSMYSHNFKHFASELMDISESTISPPEGWLMRGTMTSTITGTESESGANEYSAGAPRPWSFFLTFSSFPPPSPSLFLRN